MKFTAAFAAGLVGLLPASGPADAMAQPGFGKTLPPVGFVSFCGRNPQRCLPVALTFTPLRMTAARWRAVNRVNSLVNAQIAPESDENLYGEAEYWAYPADAGDCEDYVLLKQRYLESLGFPRSALLITVVLDEAQEGHAVLTLATGDGDFILDNRHNSIRPAAASGYTFLKRQSQQDPRDWVALGPARPANGSAFASHTEK
jgi:predicted transglutaminase-like cysteine proteinase